MATANELTIVSGTATELANEIFGEGVTVNSATYLGDSASVGIYSGADTTTPGVAPADSGIILSTGYVEDFTNSNGSTNTNTSTGTSTNTAGVNNDAQFDQLAGATTRDASILEVNFTPQGDFITLDFVIASEEYPEFTNSQFNDVVGVWVNGVQATVTVGNGDATVGNINGDTAQNLYNDNTSDQFNTEMDGFTVTLTFVAPVNPGVPNDIRIGVADVGDSSFDTNLLIAGGSVQTAIVAQDDALQLGYNGSKVVDVLANDTSIGGTLTITEIQGVPVVAGDTVTLATGQVIELNADGTLTVQGDGDDETVYFNYSVEDPDGRSQSAVVEITQAPCFVQGTMIDTPDGPRAVESLRPGDLVNTRDGGAQVLRWTGQRRVRAEGAFMPVRLAAGAFGASQDLWLSPQHRIMACGWQSELHFGADEVLVKARDLVGLHGVTLERRWDYVTYLHLLFDDHHVLNANGVACESYLPGPMTMPGFDAKTQAEILSLFPEIDELGRGYGPAARPILRSFEARAFHAA